MGKDTVLAGIIALVQEAQGSRPAMQRIADRMVVYFIPTILTPLLRHLSTGISLPTIPFYSL